MTAVVRTRVTDRVHVFTLGGETILTSYGANASAVLANGAILLVDPFIAPAHARLLEASLRELTADPVRFVVLTHHHTDHALGSGYFAGQGAVVISHERCAKRMAAEHAGLIEARRKDPALAALFRDAVPTLPGATFETWVPLSFGGISVEIRHPGHVHTPGDSFVHVPGERVAITGDLVSNGYHVNYEDASPGSLRASLDTLLALRAERFIPGHGKPGGREIVETQIRYHETVAATVRAAGREGAVAALRERFPGYLLEEVLPSGAAVFSR
jgi:glyoxylase-like metal-dependent hydrolase (beta-lactamase superfamily II)